MRISCTIKFCTSLTPDTAHSEDSVSIYFNKPAFSYGPLPINPTIHKLVTYGHTVGNPRPTKSDLRDKEARTLKRLPGGQGNTSAPQGSVSTHRGKGAELFDVLLVALRAGGPARGPPGVPERVVVLQGVLCWSRDNSLRIRGGVLEQPFSTCSGTEKTYFGITPYPLPNLVPAMCPRFCSHSKCRNGELILSPYNILSLF